MRQLGTAAKPSHLPPVICGERSQLRQDEMDDFGIARRRFLCSPPVGCDC